MRNLRQYLTATFIFMTAFVLVFYPEIVWAAPDSGSSPALESLSQISSYSVQVITAAAHFLIQFMPALWGTDLITGPDVINGIRPMWMFIRNFVNLVLVLVLLFIVFANLVTAGGEIKAGKLSEWTIKEKLPKLIFTLVAVNFTIMGIKLLADGVYVATVALFSIGDQAIVARGTESIEDMYSMKVDTKTFEQCKEGSGGGNCKPVREIINQVYCPSGDTKRDPCLFKIRDSINVSSLLDPAKKNIMIAFGHHVMHLEMLPVVAANKNLLSVLDNAIFSLVMAVAYVLAMIASFLVLLVRVIMIWVFILLSPIILASMVMGVASEDIGGILKTLMKYMVVPIKIAAAFAFSFVMVSVVETMSPSPTNFASTMEPGPPLIPFWGKEGWGWIWKILTVVLFWKAIFEFALKDIPGMGGVISKISSFGEGLAGKALTGAADTLKVPGPGGKPMGLGSTIGGLSGAGDAMKSQTRQKANTAADTLWGGKSGASDNKAINASNKLGTKLKQAGKNNANNIIQAIEGLKSSGMDKSSFDGMSSQGEKTLDSEFNKKGYGKDFITKNRKAISNAWKTGGTAVASKIKTAGTDLAKQLQGAVKLGQSTSGLDFSAVEKMNKSQMEAFQRSSVSAPGISPKQADTIAKAIKKAWDNKNP